MMSEQRVQIVVLGSGFAGSLSSLLLARRGLDVLMVDRARHPRFAIGESSTPVADMVLADIARDYDLPRIAPLAQYGSWIRTRPELMRGRKRGFSYFHHEPGKMFIPDNNHSKELLVAASNDNDRCDTHWLRADVDHFFAQEAVSAGVELWESAELVDLQMNSPWQFAIQHQGVIKKVQADFVIDATGPGRALVERMGIPDQPQRLRTNSRSVYSHFRDVPLWEDWVAQRGGAVEDYPFDADAAALHQVLDGAWMWMLRFDNDVVSIGVSMDERWPSSAMSASDQWQWWMNRFPAIRDYMSSATIVDPPGRLIATGRLQRRAERAAGDRWAALPHTVAFIDALHSTGIAHSLCGIERLVAVLTQHWQRSTLEGALAEYEQKVFRELDLIDQLVHGCYLASPWFRLFAAFSMLYFACTIAYETKRRSLMDVPATERGDFLTADDPVLRGRIDELYQTLVRLVQSRPSDSAQTEFEQLVREAIAPYNRAGLCDPAARNLYRHTAAR